MKARTWLSALLWLATVIACDRAPGPAAEKPAAEKPAAEKPAESSAASSASATHAEHDCAVAHPSRPPPQVSTATALSAEARARLTTLRVSARVGNVTVRKQGGDWVLGGADGCVVSAARMTRALDVLSRIRAERVDAQPGAFELQITALSEQERVLHFDVAQREDGKDLIQLADHSAFRVSGLERDVLSADRSVWCGP